jgi:phosphoglycolate phosphatase-like HAD superfamily hydrolase
MSVQSQPKILLFDIDGTLLTADGAGRRALSAAFLDVTGVDGAVATVDFRGMTDAIIVEQALSGLSRSLDSAPAIYARYLEHLKRELHQSQGSRALPGAADLLTAITPHRDALAIGLGTGNLEPAAYLKLERVGLASHFSFGGFGSDHRVRSEILRTAQARGAKKLGLTPGECTTIVIGDTFHDVDAALAIGARCVCVSTSGIAVDRLKAHGAHDAFESLADPCVLEILLH